jgi:shikimate kinase
MGWYLRAIKKSTGTIIALTDTPENILERITFYDIDSKLIEKCLIDKEKNRYRREIKKDITYYGKTYKRAHLQIDISGLTIEQAAGKVQEALKRFWRVEQSGSGVTAETLGRC